MGKYYEDQFCIDDYFANGTSSSESCSSRVGSGSRNNSQSSSESANPAVANGNGRGRSGSGNANADPNAAAGNRRNGNGNGNGNDNGNGNGNGNGKGNGNGDPAGKGKDEKDKPKPPKPPYFNSEFARFVNVGDEQISVSDGAPLIFTDVVDNSGEFIKFKPNTGSIILQDNGIYLAIYESQVYSTEPTACNHSLGLHLDLDGNHIDGSGTLARVGANEKAELVSHAIITTSKGAPNILQLLNQSGKNINAFGANLTLLKIGEIRDK